MINLWTGIFVIGATFYLALLFKSMAMAMLGYAQLLLMAAAFLSLAFRYRAIRCAVEIPIAAAELGRPVTVQLKTVNVSRTACSGLVYRICCFSALSRKKTGRWLGADTAFSGENFYQFQIMPDSYGSYEVNLKKIRIYDLTGLFYISKRIKSRASVLVLPEIQEASVHITESVKNFYGDADIYDADRPGYDSSELFAVRPFRNGDKIQNIHWKLSAKMEDLLVKENSLPKACPVILLLDYQKKHSIKETANAFYAAAASLSFSIMEAGCPHYAVWYSGSRKDVARMRVDDEESLYLFLCSCLEDMQADVQGDLQELYLDKYRGDAFRYSLRLDESLELLKNGEQIAKLEAHKWKESLQQLELIL